MKDLELLDRGHVPWPTWVIEHVRAHAPPDLVRMARLGVMTCQRESDLIRMGPEHRERTGIWCRPKKTRKRRRSFHVPLTAADVFELDRWKKPIDRFRDELYLYSPRGAPYTTTSLRARWLRAPGDSLAPLAQGDARRPRTTPALARMDRHPGAAL